MRISLRFQIFIAIALVCGAALAAVAAYSSHRLLLEAQHVQMRPELASRAAALQSSLERYGAVHRTLRGAETILRAAAAREHMQAVLLSPSYEPIAASWTLSRGDVTPAGPQGVRVVQKTAGETNVLILRGGAPVRVHGRIAGWLLVLPAPSPFNAAALSGRFNEGLWSAAIIAFIAALLASFLLSNSILGPLREMAQAVAAMRRGDWKRRVAVASSDEVGRLAQAFNDMAGALQQTEELRRRMVSDVAHELRSPLTRMRVELESAQDGHLPADSVLASVYRETLQLEHLVDDLRDLSLADAHALHLKCEPVSVNDAVTSVVDSAASAAALQEISLLTDLGDVPRVMADAQRLRQILRNLLDNAMRHVQRGGCVVIGAAANGSFVDCFVQDDGCGIEAHELTRIFDRFHRIDPSRSRETGGSGLGLAIVKELVEMQGGTIYAESTPGAGSRFTFRLPAHSA